RADDTDGWTVIATNYASNKGWVDGVENNFRLLHTPHRVDIWMNGELVFRETGTFQSGRFGFYNNSQQDVRYADFRVIDIDADALCGDEVLDPDEACDDGNETDGDGCSASCEIE